MQVGIIGGGQLAMMLCEAATKLGYQTIVLDPNPECSASHVANQLIVAKYDDFEAIDKLAKSSDVVTYEFENVDTDAIDEIDRKYGNVVQSSKPLKLSNDRLIEKEGAALAGFAPARFAAVNSIYEINSFAEVVGYPVVLKTRRFGYDGKGQYVIKSEADLINDEVNNILDAGAIAEEMIDLDYELSVIVIRNRDGDIKCIPSTRNVHRNNILFTSEIKVGDDYPKAKELACKYVEYHDLVGIITVEVFIDKEGTIIFNEIAPRPHNSGHYSIEGCDHSQYEMHLLAITGQQLPDSNVVRDTLMVNILGQDDEVFKQFYKDCECPCTYYHDYFKPEKRENRKVAHVTACGEEAIAKLNEYVQLVKERNE